MGVDKRTKKNRVPTSDSPPIVPAVAPGGMSSRWASLAAATIIVGAAALVYSNTWHVAFVFDDKIAVGENATIRRLWPIWQPLCPPNHGETVTGRPLLNLSFAVNYAISGPNVWSYHVANLAIHILSALLLLGILRRTFLLTSAANAPVCPFGRDSRNGQEFLPHPRESFGLALAIALLWAIHPLQTESVTYIVQRAESLVGLFYLLTLYCFIRGATSDRGRLWYAATVLACLLGMASKEVMVSAPLMVLLYDRAFLAGSFGEAWRRRYGVYLALAATWLLLAWLVIAAGNRGGSAGFGTGSSWAYLCTQFGAIVHYLKLCVWPHPLLLDYGKDTVPVTLEILPDAILVALLGLATLVALWRWPKIGFLGAWFFAILAPTSSVVPVATQVVAEHRMYLPLAAVVAAATLAGYIVCWQGARTFLSAARAGLSEADKNVRSAGARDSRSRRIADILGVCVVTAIALALGTLTYHRNADYHSDVLIWQDAVHKAPRNGRARNNYGTSLADQGRIDEAIAQYQEALKIDPDDPDAHNNYASALADRGQIEEAIAHYQQILKVYPDNADAHNNYGLALAGLGQIDEAIVHYRKALKLNPDLARAHSCYGVALVECGRIEEAIAHCRKALELDPDLAVAHSSYGVALAKRGQIDEAIAQYRTALKIDPKLAVAHNGYGMALVKRGQIDEAIPYFRKALELKPNFVEAHNNLGMALITSGRIAEAATQFEKALKINPRFAEAHNNLGMVLRAAAELTRPSLTFRKP